MFRSALRTLNVLSLSTLSVITPGHLPPAQLQFPLWSSEEEAEVDLRVMASRLEEAVLAASLRRSRRACLPALSESLWEPVEPVEEVPSGAEE